MEKNSNIEKLNNTNYFTWKYQIELVLIKEDLWDVVVEEQPESSERVAARWNKRDARARATIGLSVEKGQLVHIRDKRTAMETWNALKNVHEKDTLTNRVSLYKKIASHRMKTGTKLEDHIDELVSLFQKLCDLGEDSTEQWKIGMLFASLPKKYSTLVTALEARNESELTWSLAFTKLLDEEQRNQNDEEDVNQEKLLQVTKKDNEICIFCNTGNHNSRDCYHFKRFKRFQEFERHKQKTKTSLNEIAEVTGSASESDEDELCL